MGVVLRGYRQGDMPGSPGAAEAGQEGLKQVPLWEMECVGTRTGEELAAGGVGGAGAAGVGDRATFPEAKGGHTPAASVARPLHPKEGGSVLGDGQGRRPQGLGW